MIEKKDCVNPGVVQGSVLRVSEMEVSCNEE